MAAVFTGGRGRSRGHSLSTNSRCFSKKMTRCFSPVSEIRVETLLREFIHVFILSKVRSS
ncbi:MAG: hypothetical protein LIO85_00030 [Rikenellaceae bacterium]|nr:hypothetical protein [Rikenellaceae bacterium]